MHYYAFVHLGSENIRDEHGHRIGYVVVFCDRRERDAFCREHEAEPVSMKVARWHMLDYIRCNVDSWQAAVLGAGGSIDEIVCAYNAELA